MFKFYAKFEETDTEVYVFATEKARDKWVNFQDDFSLATGSNAEISTFNRVPLTAAQAEYICKRQLLRKTKVEDERYGDIIEVYSNNYYETERKENPMKTITKDIANAAESKPAVKLNRKISFEPTLDIATRRLLASTTMQNAFTIGNKKLAYVPVEIMNIPPYQRDRTKHVNKIAENWDDAKCNVLLLSYIPEQGWFNIVDGQHRAAAAKMRGIESLVCEINEGMTTSSESAMFVSENINSKKLSPYDTFKANLVVTGQDETELSRIDKRIAVVCDKFNVKVRASQACGTLKTVPHARKIMKREGECGLEFIFEIIRDSHWDKFPNGYSYVVMEALRKIYDNNLDNLDYVKTRLCKYLSKYSPREIESIGNNKYANLGRTARWDAVLLEAIG